MRTRSARRWLPVAGVVVIGVGLALLFGLGVLGTQRNSGNSDTPRQTAQRFATAMVARDAGAVTSLICDPSRAAAFAAQLTSGPQHTTEATLAGDITQKGDTATQRVHYTVAVGTQRQSGDSDIVMTRRAGGDWCVSDVVAAG